MAMAMINFCCIIAAPEKNPSPLLRLMRLRKKKKRLTDDQANWIEATVLCKIPFEFSVFFFGSSICFLTLFVNPHLIAHCPGTNQIGMACLYDKGHDRLYLWQLVT